jgi:hypothetical protein
MIIVRIIGGLGNQMFQFALYQALRETQSLEVKADVSEFNRYKLHNGLELERIFNINLNKASRREINILKDAGNSFTARIRRKLFGIKKSHVKERSISENQNWAIDGMYYDGYWQSEDFFSSVSESIRNIYNFPKDTEPKNIELKKNIGNRNSIAIHIRRGDYISNPVAYKELGIVCDKGYYRRAVERARVMLDSPHFYIFSDEPEWAVNNLFGSNDSYTIVDWNRGANSFRDMELMSSAGNCILCNSSFSWWGAYLNRNSGFIMAPDKWKGVADITKNRIPVGWIKIKTEV